ncbi:MAG: hypothetical protein KY429_11565 [Actinobacteria bacterium]|nr:hypothetical protein [Actinomycetota bacterium]
MRPRKGMAFVGTYAVVAIYVVLVYGAIVGASLLIGMRAGHPLPPLIATALISFSYARIRGRISWFIETRLGVRRISPEGAATYLLQTWGAGGSPSDLLDSVAEVIGKATRAAAVEVRPSIPSWPAARWTPQTDSRGDSSLLSEHVVPIVFKGEALGEIAIQSGAAGVPSPKETQMIEGLADQIALTIRNATLAEEVRRQIEEISRRSGQILAARRRTVEAQDAERRNLERNIHDGVQQYLVAMAVKLSLARRLADPRKTAEALSSVGLLAKEALERLEELTSGVSSVLLMEQGLAPALRRAVESSPIPVEVIDAGTGRLPQEAEVAIYFSCLEALQNAIKHAAASAVIIALTREEDQLGFSITDDGRGFDPKAVKAGVGLRNLSDRLAGLGGTLEISAHPGRGTSIKGRVPVLEGALR